MKISVIIPAYNEEDYIGKCLESLGDQSYPPGDYEILVINNASTDKTESVAKSFGVKVIQEENKGVVFALTAGINAARGEIVAFTDADSTVPTNWLTAINDTFEKNPAATSLVGTVDFYDGSKLFNKIYKLFENKNSYLKGSNMAIRRDALVSIGGLDQRVNLSWDFYLTKKIKKKGSIVFLKDVVVQTSARRFINNKLSVVSYLLNGIWLAIFDKPLFFNFSDVRIINK